MVNKHKVDVPALSGEEQSLLEQVCLTLELPLSRITPIVQTPPSAVPTLTSGTSTTATDSLAEATSYNGNLVISTGEVPWTSDQSADFDMLNWNEFLSTSSWDGSPSDWPWQILNDCSGLSNFPIDQPTGPIQRSIDTQNDQVGSGSSSDDEVEADIVPRLAARFGSLRVSADGVLRYYGVASNYHFLNGFRHAECKMDIEDINESARTALENAQVDDEPPLSLQNHLIELYFAWHNPSHSTVDRMMFELSRTREGLEQRAYCSQSLINAM